MLSKEILEAVRGYAAQMDKEVTFVLQPGEHPKRDELVAFLSGIASAGDKIEFVERDAGDRLRSPLSFLLEADGEDTGIRFSGIPGGHEFNSLILAMLQAAGTPMKLDPNLQRIVANIDDALQFEVVVSLSCHNCPDVVQALNQFSLLNPGITAEMIDGGLFPELIAERDIQGVPSVFLNGELFGSGKVEAGDLIDKLIERNPAIARAEPAETLPQQDVTIIGGGPAGVSAAIYCARKGLAVTLVADRLGGQVKDTMGIENLISVPTTTGPELTAALGGHLGEYDVTLREHVRVDDIEDGNVKRLTLSSGEEIRTRAVIVATGARWRELGVPGEKENIGNGVAYCPHCDGPFFKGKDVAVIGGGNSGLEAALDLAGIVNSVTVFEFMPELKADRVLVDRVLQRDNISVLTNVATKEITATNGRVDGIQYVGREDGSRQRQELSGVFVQIGLVPNSQFVGDLVETNRSGEIVIDGKCRTSTPGIFACGDVTDVPYKQIVVALGEGARAALSAFEHLMAQDAAAGGEKAAA
ncbi:MAG TPA: alkyl hydroperoxide reductase subunit F [Gammaproteobacteria bacterium]|jgi:alkyl hydroperoxide reductase subunit F